MTMSLTLVNTSNWDNEDYLVEHASIYSEGKQVIKPGETVVVYPHKDMDPVKVTPQKEGEAPFKMNGRQMVPKVDVGFEKV